MNDWDPDMSVAGALLEDPDTSATTLMVLALHALGDRLLGDHEADIPPVDPVLRWTDMNAFYGANITEAGENRLNALILAVTSDAFEVSPDAFVSVALALDSGDLGDMLDGVFEKPDLKEAAWAVTEVALNTGHVPDLSEQVLDMLLEEAQEEDEGEDKHDNEKEHVRSRIAKIEQELLSLGAPPEVVSSVWTRVSDPRHNGPAHQAA